MLPGKGLRPALAAALALLLLTTGCWDRHDPEAMAWVTAIGVDKGPGDTYIFSFQIPVITGAAGGGAGGAGTQAAKGTQIDVYAVASPDLVTAMSASQAFLARRLTLVHAKALIVGEAVAREDVRPIIGAATRYREFRRNLTVLVSKGRAYEFLKNARPRLESNASRWYELLQQSAQETGLVAPTRIHEFILETERPGVGVRATLVAYRPDVNRGSEEFDTTERTGGGEGPLVPGDTQAGSVPRSGELPVEFMGMAIFKGTKLAGFLNGNETVMVALLRGELRQAYMSLTDPLAPSERLALRIKGQHKPKIRVTRRGSQVTASFWVPVEGELVSAGAGVDYMQPQNQARLNAGISKQLEGRISALLDKTLHQWGTDLFFISNQLARGFLTIPDWDAFDWGRKVSRTTFTINVDFSIRRSGLQSEPATSRE